MPRLFPAALLLPADAFDVEQHQLLGRRIAGRSFAEGIVQQLKAGEQLIIIVTNSAERNKLTNILAPLLPADSQIIFKFGFPSEAFIQAGTLHLPDPGLAKWECLRSGLKSNSFSFTGVIHTLSSQSVFDSLAALSSSPLHRWDALVCTSSAGRKVVETAIAHQHEALERRFGTNLQKPSGPSLPLIPLAVADSLPFSSLNRSQLRSKARQELGIPNHKYIVLFVGRLSFHSKAHPLILYRAIARLHKQIPDIYLLECGHIFNQSVLDAYRDLQSMFPQIERMCLGGLVPATDNQKALALAAADVFVSPADNLQETFGLSVIEAMAASLPVVVSDWDGYRDLVVDGETGALIPTLMANGSHNYIDSTDRLYRLGLINYDTFVGIRSLDVIVDEDAFVSSLYELYLQPERRELWGSNARNRWQKLFSWPVVSEQYRSLWEELAELRSNSSDLNPEPSFSGPSAKLFAHYSSKHFLNDCVYSRKSHGSPVAVLKRTTQQAFLSSICGPGYEPLLAHFEQNNSINIHQLEAMGVEPDKCRSVLAALVKFGVASI
jgi:glycosyltransferase involved in cell wall biosynthesis